MRLSQNSHAHKRLYDLMICIFSIFSGIRSICIYHKIPIHTEVVSFVSAHSFLVFVTYVFASISTHTHIPGPMVLFATPGMLHGGLSTEVFKKWGIFSLFTTSFCYVCLCLYMYIYICTYMYFFFVNHIVLLLASIYCTIYKERKNNQIFYKKLISKSV